MKQFISHYKPNGKDNYYYHSCYINGVPSSIDLQTGHIYTYQCFKSVEEIVHNDRRDGFSIVVDPKEINKILMMSELVK